MTARHAAANGSDFVLLAEMPFSDWIAGGRAAAICSGSYCLSSNQWSQAGTGPDCGGVGWIIDPEGVVVATTSEEQPFATVEVDLDFSRRSKSTYPRYVHE